MTEAEIDQAERDAERDAEWLALLLLLAFRRRRGRDVADVRFDAARGRFYLNGRAVSLRSIRAHLTRIEDRMARRLVRITNRLERGEITIDEWKREFDRSITSAHILTGAFAIGAIGLAARDEFVQRQIADQLRFADRFAEDVRRGRAGSFAMIRRRVRSYLQAAHITYTNLDLRIAKRTGVRTEVRNLLRPAEHCWDTKAHIDRNGTPQPARRGCPELTKLGWMPVEQMIPIGERSCTIWCKCYLEYR